jgi:hypothetical protein
MNKNKQFERFRFWLKNSNKKIEISENQEYVVFFKSPDKDQIKIVNDVFC